MTTYNHFYICPLSNSLAWLKRSSHFCQTPVIFPALTNFISRWLPTSLEFHTTAWATPLVSTVCAPPSINSFLPVYPSLRVDANLLPEASLGSSTPLRGPDISREHAFMTVSSGTDTNAYSTALQSPTPTSHLCQALGSSPWLPVTKALVSNTSPHTIHIYVLGWVQDKYSLWEFPRILPGILLSLVNRSKHFHFFCSCNITIMFHFLSFSFIQGFHRLTEVYSF